MKQLAAVIGIVVLVVGAAVVSGYAVDRTRTQNLRQVLHEADSLATGPPRDDALPYFTMHNDLAAAAGVEPCSAFAVRSPSSPVLSLLAGNPVAVPVQVRVVADGELVEPRVALEVRHARASGLVDCTAPADPVGPLLVQVRAVVMDPGGVRGRGQR